jgi:hypothetical protein
MADAVAISNVITVEVQGRVRTPFLSGAAATLIRPTAKFIMRTNEGIGINWRVDRTDGVMVEAIEVWT